MGGYYFFACLLPPIPSIPGEKLPVPFTEISRIIHRNIHPADDALLWAHLAVIDTANWENREQGQGLFPGWRYPKPGGSRVQTEICRLLSGLSGGERARDSAPYIPDRLWELYYGTLLSQAEKEKCRYLICYIPWEIELRNQLTALRLQNSSRGIEEHTIMPAIRNYDFTTLLSELDVQKNPLFAERYLDEERLKRICHCEVNDPFSLDNLLAFLSRAMIYSRWEKLQVPYDMNDFLYGGG